MRAFFLSIVCGLTVAVSWAQKPNDSPQRVELRRLLDLVLEIDPFSLGTLEETFGKHVSAKEETGENNSQISMVEFKGATVRMFKPPYSNNYVVVRLKISRNFAPLKMPISIGASKSQLRSLLGLPQKESKRKIEYVYQLPESGDDGDRMIFTIVNDKISEIEWGPYFD